MPGKVRGKSKLGTGRGPGPGDYPCFGWFDHIPRESMASLQGAPYTATSFLLSNRWVPEFKSNGTVHT